MEDFLFSLRGLKSLSPAASTLQCHTRRGKLAEWLHGATHEYHVNVGSEPALGFTALTPTPSYFLHVRVSLFMRVWFFFSFLPPSCLRLMQNGRGIPNHPLFHAAFTFHPPSPAQFFCPSGFSERPSDFLRLWSRRSDTLYIMACAMLKGLITLPLISLQQHQGHLIQWTCSVYHQYLSANAVIKVKTGCGWHSAPFVFRPVCCTLRHVCCGIIYGNLASSFAERQTRLQKKNLFSLSRQA